MRTLLAAVLVLSSFSARAQEADDDAAVTEDAEAESLDPAALASGIRYTADLSDEQLLKVWTENPTRLGSLSVGFDGSST